MQEISSVKNPLVKKVMALNKKKGRTIHGQFLVEGIREIQMAIEAGIQPIEILYNEYWQPEELERFRQSVGDSKDYILSDAVFEKISYRSSVANALAIFPLFDTNLSSLNLQGNSLILVLEAIEKPGNMGAIFRTADAAGIDAIIIANANTDFYNPNVIRASLGTVFTVPFAICNNEDCLEFLNSNNFNIYSTYLEASVPHFDVDMANSTALVMGSEAFGITDFWVDHANTCIKIPMRGKADSMNVSTAAAVVVYEGIRQRTVT